MRIRPKATYYAPDGYAETRFNKTIKQYDGLMGQLMAQNNVLRIVALVSLVCVPLSFIGWYKTIKLPRTVPLVVEVSEFGVPRYVGKIDEISYQTFKPKDYIIKAHIARFLQYTREIMLDSEMMARDMNEAALWVSSDMRARLKADVLGVDPFGQVGKIKLKVEIESIILTTENTWQADWVDIRETLSGQELMRQKYRGLFTIAQQEPATDRDKDVNPLGIYIIDYNIVEIKKAI